MQSILTPLTLFSLCLPLLACGRSASAADPAAPDPRMIVRRIPGLQSSGQAYGSVLLPNQWSLHPAGKQIELGNFPVNIALSPQGDWLAILHAGFGEHCIQIVDARQAIVHSTTRLATTFYGICFSPDGKRLFASGGEEDTVHQFDFADGSLGGHTLLPLTSDKAPVGLIPAGMACRRDGASLYVACCLGQRVLIVPVEKPNEKANEKRSIAMPNESYPYAVLPCTKADRLLVSLWGKSAIAVVDIARGRIAATWPTSSHPTEMVLSPDENELFVACADSNRVVALDAKTGQTLELIDTALYPNAPNGSTPNSLALSPDGKTLWIANAGNNNVAAIDVSVRGRARSLGFLPVGWYPTSVRYDAGADAIFVANAKGASSKANRNGPNPLVSGERPSAEYIGGLLVGSLSIVKRPSSDAMRELTARAYACSPLRANPDFTRPDSTRSTRAAGFPIPTTAGGGSPIKHCIYVIRENRTYDQVLGDVPQGNGDPALCIFPEKTTPNAHKLAREFVLLDNFYCDGELSANGHEWSMAAYATDFVEKVWPHTYRRHDEHSGRKPAGFDYPAEGRYAIAAPSSGYIWDRCKQKGIDYRSYGEFIENGLTSADPGHASVAALAGHFDPLFRSFDLDYSDLDRVKRFRRELAEFETRGRMPPFIVLRLPNDHTAGTSPGKLTPTAYVAQNDLALGLFVEAVSHSKFWPDTAIFVLEDDAQNGSDHVDAHRSPAFIVSPFTKRGYVDSNFYSTSSVLRTMELILGLPPMSQFDAAALPMYASFQSEAKTAPFEHVDPRTDINAVSSQHDFGAIESQQMNFADADAADPRMLNDIIWRSVRGANSPVPPPVRAAFVRTEENKRDKD